MKIAIFTDTFTPHINGVVTHIITTAEAFLQKGHDVLIFTPKPVDIQPYSHLPIVYLSSIPFFIYTDFRLSLPFSPTAFDEIKQFSPDIIHFHTPSALGSNAIFCAKKLGIPLVGSFHTYFMEPEYMRILGLHKIHLDKNFFVQKAGWKFASLFYTQADHIVSPSNYTKEHLRENGINQPITVISNGVDLLAVHKKNIPYQDRKYFLYVGRVSREKNLDTLIRAFHLFSKKNSTIHLKIVGDGPALDEVKKLTRTLSLQKRIEFTGMISHEELIHSPLYNEALSFVTTSTSETQGISILEAMSYSLPIIAAKSRGLGELIKNNGILCPSDNERDFAQAFTTFASDEKKQKLCSDISEKLVKKHSLSTTVEKLEELYRTMKNKR